MTPDWQTIMANGSKEQVSKEQVSKEQGSNKYIVSPKMVLLTGIGLLAFAVLTISTLLWRASSQPQGRYTNVNTSQYARTITTAAADLAGTASTSANTDSGNYQIPIDQAISIVAQQGITSTSDQLASTGDATSNLLAEAAPWSLKDATAVAVTAANASEQVAAAPQTAPAATMPAVPTGDTEMAVAEAAPQAPQAMPDAAAEAAAEATPVAAAPAGPSNADIMASLPSGETVFNNNCASCHQANGQGITGAFPSLVGHAPTLYNADREYLPNLLLYGLQGQINAAGVGYNGIMPAWAQLSDEDLAAVLNYITTSWGNESDLNNFMAYQPEDVASKRSNGYSAIQIHDELRANLNLQ
jgi:mono/diheme cytochrome c family protein